MRAARTGLHVRGSRGGGGGGPNSWRRVALAKGFMTISAEEAPRSDESRLGGSMISPPILALS